MEPYLLKISLTVLLGILSFFDISDTEIPFSFSKIIDFFLQMFSFTHYIEPISIMCANYLGGITTPPKL